MTPHPRLGQQTQMVETKTGPSSWRRAASMVRAAPQPELDQALLRVFVSALIVTYMACYLSGGRTIAVGQSTVVFAVVLFLGVASAIAIRIITSPEPSVARRLAGMIADNAATSYSMILMDEVGAVLIGAYLFIALGNGFRFGRRYLYASQAMACLGFAVVLQVSPFWGGHTATGLGFLITLAIVPLSVGVLAEQMEKARRRADDANRAKGRFLASASHEMRAPLNAVIAMADLLRETRLSEPQTEIVQTLGTSAQLLLAQIEDVLDILRLEAGRIAVVREPFDLRALLVSLVEVMTPQAGCKGLTITLDVAATICGRFVGDEHHLRQVLLNLLANAVKFTDQGGVSLRTTTVDSGQSETRIRFEVADTGIGVPANRQGVIFEAFAQADDSSTRRYEGTGLGTTIAKELVTLMGGEIGVQSQSGVGTTFWFELPFATCDTPTVDPGAEAQAKEPLTTTGDSAPSKVPANISRLRGAHILVAQDNPTNQRVTQLILESGGHTATIVGNGEEALNALQEHQFHLALFDLSMPVVSGIEALKMYRCTTARSIPVLIVSANVTPEVIAECKNAGAAELVSKPLRPAALLAAIERHLAPRALAEPLDPPSSDGKPRLSLIDTPIVDAQVIDNLERLSPDPTFLERLVAGFRVDADRLLADIELAFRAQRLEKIKDIAQALKGGAGTVGAVQLMHSAARLEKTNTVLLGQRTNLLLEELHRATKQALAVLDQCVAARREGRRSRRTE